MPSNNPHVPDRDELRPGGAADIEVRFGDTTTRTSVSMKPGERGFVVPVRLAAAGGEVEVRARFSTKGLSVPITDSVDAGAAQPLLFRRSPARANRMVPAADSYFSRTERLRLELPAGPGTKGVSARLLDKKGQPLKVPVTAGQRMDDEAGSCGSRQISPWRHLLRGDHAIELTTSCGTETRLSITGFRVGR